MEIGIPLSQVTDLKNLLKLLKQCHILLRLRFKVFIHHIDRLSTDLRHQNIFTCKVTIRPIMLTCWCNCHALPFYPNVKILVINFNIPGTCPSSITLTGHTNWRKTSKDLHIQNFKSTSSLFKLALNLLVVNHDRRLCLFLICHIDQNGGT